MARTDRLLAPGTIDAVPAEDAAGDRVYRTDDIPTGVCNPAHDELVSDASFVDPVRAVLGQGE